MRLISFVIAVFLPVLGLADTTALPKTRDAVTNHVAVTQRVLRVLEREFGSFQREAHHLADISAAYCAGDADETRLKDQFATTWLAWAPLDAFQFGPIEAEGAALRVNFFPDKKNFVGRALASFLTLPDDEQADPAVVAANSAGVQGFPAIERLLYDDLQTCPAIIGITANLAALSDRLYAGWFADGGWADLARAAGPDNPVYHKPEEFTRQIYTALSFSILRMREHRLSRPLGSYERSFPKRAEAWRSGLTNEILKAQLNGIPDIVDNGFAGDVSNPTRAWIRKVVSDIAARIDAVGAPISEAVAQPVTRIRVEGLLTKFEYLQLQLDQDVGPGLGVETGFSAGDGD